MKTNIIKSFALLFGVLLASLMAGNVAAQEGPYMCSTMELRAALTLSPPSNDMECRSINQDCPRFSMGIEGPNECLLAEDRDFCTMAFPGEDLVFHGDPNRANVGFCRPPCPGTGKERMANSDGRPGMCSCPSGEENFRQNTPSEMDDVCAPPMMCDNGYEVIRDNDGNFNRNECVCPAGTQEFRNDPAIDTDDVCEAPRECDMGNGLHIPGDAARNVCVCMESSHLLFNNGTASDLSDDFCAAPAGCEGGMRNDMNVCECTTDGHMVFNNGTASDLSDDFCAAPAGCEGGMRNDMNVCECTTSGHVVFNNGTASDLSDDFCAAACRDDQVQSGGVTCACPAGEQEFNNASGVVECAAPVACSGGEVRAPVNACVCPAGNMLVGSECQPIPQSDDGDPIIRYAAPAAIVGMLVVANIYSQGSYELIPAFDVSGENENFTWSSGVRSESNDGRFSSFVSAAHSSYESGVIVESGGKYGADLFDMQYRSKESNERLEYEFQLSSPFAFGLWEVSPSAEAEFEYESESRTWDSASSLDIAAAWSAHRWRIKAGSSFAFDGASHQAVKFEAEKRF